VARTPKPRPFNDRPVISLHEVSTILVSRGFAYRRKSRKHTNELGIFVSSVRLRQLCSIAPAIPVKQGGWISVTSLHRLLQRLATLANRPLCRKGGHVVEMKHLDRISLLLWLAGLSEVVIRRPRQYAATIDAEIKRIKQIRDPILKAMRACELLARFVDAKALADAVRDGFPLSPSGAMRMVRELDHILGIDQL